MRLYIFDTESDDLVDAMTKFHCLLFKLYGKDEWILFIDHEHPDFEEAVEFINSKDAHCDIYDFSEFEDWILSDEVDGIACHNMFGFDLPAFRKMYDIDYTFFPENIGGEEKRLFDTLSMSRCLYPDRPLPKGCPIKVHNPVTGKMDSVGPHGLMAWGYRLANQKVEVHDWRDQPLTVYLDRVWEDVIINELTWTELCKEAKDISRGDNKPKLGLPSDWSGPMRLNNKSDYLMAKQFEDGVLLDQEAAYNLVDTIDRMMDELAEDVESQLPLRMLPKSQRANFPSEPFKQNGEISSHGFNWLKRLGYEINDEAFELVKIPAKPFKADMTLSAHGENFCKKMGFEGTLEEKRKSINNLRAYQETVKPLPDAEMKKAIKDLKDGKEPSWLVPMEISNQDDIKKFLVESEGWQPTIWNTKDCTRNQFKQPYTQDETDEKIKDYIIKIKQSPYRQFVEEEMEVSFRLPDAKLMRKLERQARFLVTTPKLKDERGELCPSLRMLQGEMAQKIVKWLSLRNRRSVLKTKDPKKNTGWLNNPRLQIDGRIGQGNSGVTNTNRYKHREIVNLPKAAPDVLLGKEMRSLFIAPEGKKILGYDGSNLEQFVAGSYAWVFDGGDYLESLAGDSHTTNAKAYSIAAGREVTRSDGKNVTYAVLYGAQAAKIAKMLGVSKDQAQAVIDAFWDTNYGLKKLKESLERYWKSTGNKYIRGIDGRKIYTRSQHSLVNALFQSCGAILMSLSGCFMYNMLMKRGLLDKGVTRLAYIHDEFQYEVPDELIDVYTFETEEEAKNFSVEGKLLSSVKKVEGKFIRYYCIIGDLGNKSLQMAGEYLNMPVEFRADYDIGINFSETH